MGTLWAARRSCSPRWKSDQQSDTVQQCPRWVTWLMTRIRIWTLHFDMDFDQQWTRINLQSRIILNWKKLLFVYVIMFLLTYLRTYLTWDACRVFRFKFTVLPLLSQCLPVLDELCRRFLNFVSVMYRTWICFYSIHYFAWTAGS